MQTELSKTLGVEHAVFGFTPFPAVAAAISRAGGFGVLGAVRYTAPDDLKRDLDWIEAHVDGKPYGLDVVMPAKKVENVSEADALDYVLGYCSGQDFSARDLQHLTSQWMLGKTTDGSGPLGPWLVGAELVDPDNLDIQCLINGEVRQSANTREMIFNCRTLVSFASRHMSLKPGDVIFTGTPEGVIAGYPADKQVWLKKGDKIVTRIQSLGDLEVTLV